MVHYYQLGGHMFTQKNNDIATRCSPIEIGKRIRQARNKLGISQEELAEEISKLGDFSRIGRTAIVQWESGETQQITAKHLLRAALVLTVSPNWLIFGVEML